MVATSSLIFCSRVLRSYRFHIYPASIQSKPSRFQFSLVSSNTPLHLQYATDAVGKIKIDKSSGPIELLLQPKSRKKYNNNKKKEEKNQPAKLKTRKGGLGKN